MRLSEISQKVSIFDCLGNTDLDFISCKDLWGNLKLWSQYLHFPFHFNHTYSFTSLQHVVCKTYLFKLIWSYKSKIDKSCRLLLKCIFLRLTCMLGNWKVWSENRKFSSNFTQVYSFRSSQHLKCKSVF